MSEENQAVIKALNMYGRVPEMWELLEENERLRYLEQENKQLKEEIEIKDRLIDGIKERLKTHFRKIDRNGLEDNAMLLKIQELIKTATGDKE